MFQILIVDDDKNVRRYLGAVLAEAGYSPHTASSAKEAMEKLETISIDLMILDIMMPGMDGYEFTKLLRDCHCDLPILMLSAKQLPDNIKHGFLAGTDDYMTKPVDEEELILRIRALLRRARIASERRLVIGSTELNYDALTVKCGDTSQVSPPERVSTALSAAVLSQQDLYQTAASGGDLGTGLRLHGVHRQRPHQPAAETVRSESGFPDCDDPRSRLQGTDFGGGIMKKSDRVSFRTILVVTGLIFLLLVLTTVISNTIVFIGIKSGILDMRPESRLLPFLIQAGIISILTGTLLSLILSRFPMRSVQKLIRAIHRVAEGHFDTKISLKHPKEFRELSDCFNQMTDELAGIEILRSDFINNFSHEFRTPIMSILGFARLIKRGNLSEEEKNEYLDIIISESRRLSELSSQVLNLSKVESLTLLTDLSVFNAGEQIREAILQLEQKWNSRNISFDLEIEDVKVRGNRSLLKEVWVNLIDNAIKFSPKNSIISISAYSNGKDMVFAIEDRGEGMDEATCDKIFDKFYQGDTSHATEGNGLGLSLVRKIVELHHGSIKVKSQPGRGSIFVVMLPLEG